MDTQTPGDRVLAALIERESKRLANELHDGVAQDLTYLATRVSLLRQAIAQSDAAAVSRYLDGLEHALAGVQLAVRSLISHGRLAVDDASLRLRVTELCERWQTKTELTAALDWRVGDVELGAHDKAEVLYILGEAFSNIHRHANASRVDLVVSQLGADLQFEVRDNGCGLPANVSASAEDSHFGILIMRERAQALGASLGLEPIAAGGTLVRLVLPLARELRDAG